MPQLFPRAAGRRGPCARCTRESRSAPSRPVGPTSQCSSRLPVRHAPSHAQSLFQSQQSCCCRSRGGPRGTNRWGLDAFSWYARLQSTFAGKSELHGRYCRSLQRSRRKHDGARKRSHWSSQAQSAARGRSTRRTRSSLRGTWACARRGRRRRRRGRRTSSPRPRRSSWRTCSSPRRRSAPHSRFAVRRGTACCRRRRAARAAPRRRRPGPRASGASRAQKSFSQCAGIDGAAARWL